ncbi:DUF3576 domain-containing protein [Sulfitobacter sp.]|uniref:DUF3576 domain-containing protein n=1 Tax=Sulfitobacter sp. TaxID=1903071 RepID=UPI00329954CF
MGRIKARNIAAMALAAGILAACGGGLGLGQPTNQIEDKVTPNDPAEDSSIFDLFKQTNDETAVSVNRYLWSASLEVLNFLPIQAVDPFTGVISTGFGTPPGGGRAYRATVLIDDPALDARSLNVALQSRSGPVSQATSRAVEDAILSRARELRIADNKL